MGLKIFVEDSSDNANVFNMYRDSVALDPSGAALFGVVNGRMSEGINFSDDFARHFF